MNVQFFRVERGIVKTKQQSLFTSNLAHVPLVGDLVIYDDVYYSVSHRNWVFTKIIPVVVQIFLTEVGNAKVPL